MKNRDIGFGEFILLIALLMALVSLAINMLLPAFKDITDELKLKDKNQIQLSISLLYLGLGASQLIYGPISDTIGRKPAIYIGLILFLAGCGISYYSNNLTTLIAGQIIQGLGLGAPRVLSIAIVRDQFNDNQMARAMSFIMIIYILTPTISPVLGKAIIIAFNWRSVFLGFIFFSLLIFLLFKYRMPETLLNENRKDFTIQHIFTATYEVLKNRKSLGFILILGLYSGVFIAYLNLSQAIFEVQYRLGDKYPLYFAILALSIGLASFINGKIVTKTGMNTIVKYTVTISILFSVAFFVSVYFGNHSFELFFAFMFFQLMGYGFLIGNLSTLAIQPFGHIAGLGASIIGAVSTIISVPISIFIGQFYKDSTLPLILGFLGVGIISILIFNFINKKTLTWKTIL